MFFSYTFTTALCLRSTQSHLLSCLVKGKDALATQLVLTIPQLTG